MEREYFDPYDTSADLAFYGQSAPPAAGPSPATSDSREAPMGLSFWNARGYPNNQIFGPNGQLLPGWSRTAQGYMFEPPAASSGGSTLYGGADPNYGVPPPSQGGGGGRGGFDPYTAYGRDLSQMLPFPAYQSAPGLNFDPFSPSSWEDAENEPGYKASRVQLRKQIEAGAAHGGMLRSGMTIGDLYTNLDALGQQNFRQFDDRRFRNWSGNRDLAVVKQRAAADDIDRGNNYRFNVADRSAQDALSRWKTVTDGLVNLSRPVD